VLTADNVIMVCSSLDLPLVFIAMIVPVDDVTPGIIDTIKPAIVPVKTDMTDDVLYGFLMLTGFIVCSGITGLVSSDTMMVGAPNKPVRIGSSVFDGRLKGEYAGSESAIRPYTPDRMNKPAADSIPSIEGRIPDTPGKYILPFSVVIISMDTAIRM